MMGPVDDAVSAPAAEEALPRGRVVVANTAGIFVEAFDWTVYGLLLRHSLLYDDTDAELAGRPAEAAQ